MTRTASVVRSWPDKDPGRRFADLLIDGVPIQVRDPKQLLTDSNVGQVVLVELCSKSTPSLLTVTEP